MPIDRRKTGGRRGHDTAYRTRNLYTHPTHGCIEDFCGFEAMRIASRWSHLPGIRAIPPFLAMENRIAIGTVR